MRRDIVIFGTGGMGRDVLFVFEQMMKNNSFEYNLLGFIDDSISGKVINGYPVIGDSAFLMSREKDLCVVLALGVSKTRKAVYEKLRTNHYLSFPAIIAHDAQVSTDSSIGQGSIISLSSIVGPNSKIGDFVITLPRTIVGHDNIIGDFTTLYAAVTLSGNVTLGDLCQVGTVTSIIPGVSVGKGVITGAGSVIVRDIKDDVTVVGVPARIIKTHN